MRSLRSARERGMAGASVTAQIHSLQMAWLHQNQKGYQSQYTDSSVSHGTALPVEVRNGGCMDSSPQPSGPQPQRLPVRLLQFPSVYLQGIISHFYFIDRRGLQDAGNR